MFHDGSELVGKACADRLHNRPPSQGREQQTGFSREGIFPKRGRSGTIQMRVRAVLSAQAEEEMRLIQGDGPR